MQARQGCLVKTSVSSEVFKLFLTETVSYRECGEWVLEQNVQVLEMDSALRETERTWEAGSRAEHAGSRAGL